MLLVNTGVCESGDWRFRVGTANNSPSNKLPTCPGCQPYRLLLLPDRLGDMPLPALLNVRVPRVPARSFDSGIVAHPERLGRRPLGRTFETYCKERWGFSRSYSHRLIEAADITEQMLPIGNIPTTESQARELARVEPEKMGQLAYL